LKKWFEHTGEAEDIVISSRIRLARNLALKPFPSQADAEQSAEVVAAVSSAMERLGQSFEGFESVDLTKDKLALYSRSLVEKHLISSDFAEASRPRALFLSKDEAVSIMVNEEDHIRLQVLGAGLCLEPIYDLADKLDDLLDESLNFAFDERLGYLTECPTNLGCGLRASVMMHLPALTESGQISRFINAASKLGIAVRGLYGEGSQAIGAIYQISNRLTLGYCEKEIIEQLGSTVGNIIRDERRLRDKTSQNKPAFEDRIYRSLAILSSARVLSTDEAMARLSDLRLGAGRENFPDITTLNRFLWEIQPASLILGREEIPTPAQRDALRADLIRRELEGLRS
jgi:protein arginine kinase